MSNLNDVDWGRIPAPENDGGADHLSGMSVPSIGLATTGGQVLDLSKLRGRTVVYVYPMTGRPDMPLPDGWDLIPGARGCTPQACSFRDHASELRELAVDHIFGLSAQGTAYQQEAAARLHLPFPLLSDEGLSLSKALGLPTFTVQQMTLMKRLTMIIDDGVISKVFYPVFPPDKNVELVIEWLSATR